jgi:uncharacterized protein (TIGR04540 family)
VKYRTYCKNQREVASVINGIIDEYWSGKLSEKEMKEDVLTLCENNKEKLFKDGQFTKIIQQQCGKKRINVISKILKNKLEKPE